MKPLSDCQAPAREASQKDRVLVPCWVSGPRRRKSKAEIRACHSQSSYCSHRCSQVKVSPPGPGRVFC